MGVNSGWVPLPSDWINEGNLKELRWRNGGEGSDNIAALMALTAIAHVADRETGIARATYDEICLATDLSRAKLSGGLSRLEDLRLVERNPDGNRSQYRLAGKDGYWAQFPARSMYSGGRIHCFSDFPLRRRIGLDALKLFFLFVARRDTRTNLTNLGYDKIQEYSAVDRPRIKPAISFLASIPLVYVEHVPSQAWEGGTANAYRICGLETRRHMGTTGRASDGVLSAP